VKKLLILAVLAGLVGAFFGLGLNQYLTFEGMKGAIGQWDAFYAENPVLVVAGFFLAYVAVTAASLPGAAIMTLAAGALFGLVVGIVLVSFASTIGASLAFLASRHVLRESIEARFGERLRSVNEGLERDGAFYLFTLRMIPIFPFFVVNLVMGLTRIRLLTFVWVSQIGMLLGTIVYVNAGTQLARIESLSGIASPALLGSFALLGLAPWFAKLLIGAVKSRRVYAGFQRPRRFDRNLVVIGAGSAGLVSAYIAATVKAKVTLVEAKAMGGDCLNTGCVPSKALIKSAKVAEQMRRADRYGIVPVTPQVPFGETMRRVQEIIRAIEPHDSVERFEGLGVDVVQGYARIIDPWTVEIAGDDGGTQRLTTRSIILATGAEPVVPDVPGIEASGYLTSETMWEAFAEMAEVPARMAILGGGPIGCEMAQAFARLGAQVTLVEASERLLAREDEEVSALATAVLEEAGVRILIGYRAARFEDGLLIAEQEGDETRVPYDALIVAVGRRARLAGYGLETLGIRADEKLLPDGFLATRYPNILAAGDVAGPYQLTHVASHQAWYATVNALFGHLRKFRADYRVIPQVTFLEPEFARVGLNEREAQAKGIAYEVTRYDIDDLDRAIAESDTRGFVKVLTAKGKDRILGVTIVAPHAGELLAEYVLAMKHGLGLNKILGTIHAYPTMAEANKYVAGQWKLGRKPEKLLAWVEKYHAWRRG
jgi:pyruvate/2-oxoglutarate dehydrogenase complex dihydrolipoamide dehydrogenase (E3) component/uncharacterized membrane protein YdjX (TVP38/TMEM64 family)